MSRFSHDVCKKPGQSHTEYANPIAYNKGLPWSQGNTCCISPAFSVQVMFTLRPPLSDHRNALP
jgi:hypothetical protein